jgi:hypothetical protein
VCYCSAARVRLCVRAPPYRGRRWNLHYNLWGLAQGPVGAQMQKANTDVHREINGRHKYCKEVLPHRKKLAMDFCGTPPPQATRTCPSHEQSPTIVTTPRRGGPQPPLVPSPTAAPNVVANSRRRRVPVFRLPRSCLQSSPIRACFSVIRTHWYCMRVSDCLHTSIYQNRYCSYQEHGLTIQNGESC